MIILVGQDDISIKHQLIIIFSHRGEGERERERGRETEGERGGGGGGEGAKKRNPKKIFLTGEGGKK